MASRANAARRWSTRMARAEAAGFAIGVRELPDYIPLYLEYLASREDLEAREGLADVAHLLALLAARLEERESPYAACFRALLQIAGEQPAVAVAEVREQVAGEVRDDSLEALDKLWRRRRPWTSSRPSSRTAARARPRCRARLAKRCRCRCTGSISSRTGRPACRPRRCTMANLNFLAFGVYPISPWRSA